MGQWLRLCSLGGLSALVGSQAPTRQLDRLASEFPHGFTRVRALRPLSNGRVIVVDSKDRRLLLLDWERGTMANVAREGSGPLEIRTPTDLLGMPRDTTWAFDVVNWRWLIIGPDGAPRSTLTTRDASPELSRGTVLGADDMGRIYVQVEDHAGRSPMAGSSGKAHVLRVSRTPWRADTIASLRLPSGRMIGAQPLAGGLIRQVNSRPFAPEDVATPMPEGGLIVVRSPEYQVEHWKEPGRVSRGPVLAYPKVKVTEEERRAFVRRQVIPGQVMVFSNDGKPATPAPTVPQESDGSVDEHVRRVPWPAEMPPVRTGARVDRDGMLWVPRVLSSRDSLPTYDLIDRAGNRRSTVRLPARSRLAAFGRSVVYVIRVDDDDIEYIQRYHWP